VFVSARTGQGMDRLRAAIAERLPRPRHELEVLLPYNEGGLAARVHEHGQVLAEEHRAAGTWLHARVSEDLAAALRDYRVAPAEQPAPGAPAGRTSVG
jgi:GTPase